LGVLCCVLGVALPIGLLIGAAILRGGVHFANKCLPKEVERDDDDYDDWDDYDRPRRRRRAALIPEPGLGKAMGIVLVRAIIGFVVSIPINLVLGLGVAGAGGGPGGGARPDPGLQIMASLIQLPIGFLVNAGVLTRMLPTSFARACLVVVFEYLIVLGIALIIGVPLVALLFLAR
jgi:hypothetical protein